MKRFERKKRTGEKGFSLVEVLASIVILSLILMTFMMMVYYSAKTGRTSENIIDATYIAQIEMEKVYNTNKGSINAAFNSLGYSEEPSPKFRPSSPTGKWITFTKKSEGFDVETQIEVNNDKLKRSIIDVFEDDVHRARMQNVFVWEEE